MVFLIQENKEVEKIKQEKRVKEEKEEKINVKKENDEKQESTQVKVESEVKQSSEDVEDINLEDGGEDGEDMGNLVEETSGEGETGKHEDQVQVKEEQTNDDQCDEEASGDFVSYIIIFSIRCFLGWSVIGCFLTAVFIHQ